MVSPLVLVGVGHSALALVLVGPLLVVVGIMVVAGVAVAKVMVLVARGSSDSCSVVSGCWLGVGHMPCGSCWVYSWGFLVYRWVDMYVWVDPTSSAAS